MTAAHAQLPSSSASSPFERPTLELTQATSQPLRLQTSESGTETNKNDLEDIAGELSYFGAVILTAHEILTSVQNWTDFLEYKGRDGTLLEMTKTPRGMGVMVRVRMPLD